MLKQNSISLSFDVEDLYCIRNRAKSDKKEFSSHHESGFDCITEPTLKILDLLDKKNISATFFVVSDILEKYPTLSKRLKESQHEIGCHSSSHDVPNIFESMHKIEEWKNDIQYAKVKLSNYFEKKIIGYRAPSAYLYDWMLDILINNGFSYDSSVSNNFIYNKTNFKNNNISGSPYIIKSNQNKDLVELPFNTLPLLGLNLPSSGAFFYRVLGNRYTILSLNRSLALSHTSFYLHPLDFSDKSFTTEKGIKKSLYWINKGEKLFKKFEYLLDQFNGKWTDSASVYKDFYEKYRL